MKARTKYWESLGFVYAALLYAILFLTSTRLVPEWGRWYSENTYYREQTEAFRRGSLALHHTPTALRLDLAWYNGGVQQVWGLGVPCWRFLFETIAKLCGQPAFPDRLAFGFALAGLAFFSLKVFLGAPAGLPLKLLKLAAAAIVLFFPPFVSLCRFRFDVYEESIAYGYCYAIALFLGLLSFVRAPTQVRCFVLSSMAGLAPCIRPTLGAYGLATIFLLWLLSRKVGFGLWQSNMCCLPFGLGGVLLLITNKIRFGSMVEFGHNLNFNAFPLWMFNRFYGPFQYEPLIPAARELFGCLFCPAFLNDLNWGMRNLFWGQSFTPRWRRLYLTCFDFSFFGLILLSWATWLVSLVQKYRRRINLPIEASLASAWSIIAIASLFIFYLRTPVITSRYLMDFGPGVAIAAAGLCLGFDSLIRESRFYRLILGASVGTILIWLFLETHASRANIAPIAVLTQAELLKVLPRDFPEPQALPTSYAIGTVSSYYGIPYNESGWDQQSGRMAAVSVFFVSDPSYLEIRVAPIRRDRKIDYSNIQVKIGLEALVLESLQQDTDSCAIRFKSPKHFAYRKGTQVVFLAYVDKINIESPESPLRVLEVKWR